MGKVIEHEHEYEHDYENKLEDFALGNADASWRRASPRASHANEIRDALAP
jgi:hypothetical protein